VTPSDPPAANAPSAQGPATDLPATVRPIEDASASPRRALIAGLFAGAMLGAAVAPLGVDVVGLVAVDGATSALFRAVPWILLAGLLGRPARAFAAGVPAGWLATGAVLGMAFERLAVGPPERFGARASIGLAVIVCAAGVWFSVRRAHPGRDPLAPDPRPSLLAWLGLIAAGAGLALAFAPLGYHLEHLGLASDAETSVRAVVLSALVFVGCIAFGPLIPARARNAALPVLIAAAAAAAFVGVALLTGLQEPRMLEGYLRRFGFDFSSIGRLLPTALLASLVFVAPALLAGTALAAARERVRLSAVLLGVGVGIALWPVLVDASAGAPQAAPEMFAREAEAWTWARVALGARIAVAGALVAVLGSARGAARWIALAATVACLTAPYLAPRRPIWILSPWHRVPVEPDLAWNTGDGLLTVERDREGTRFVTLDRRRMTPIGLEDPLDALRFDAAWRLLPTEVRTSDDVRVLLVGQMTPARAFHLRRYPTARVDHTVPWHVHRAAVDELLFEGSEPMPGAAIAPDEARARLAEGGYDLVLVPATRGPLMLPRSAAVLPWAAAPAPVAAGLAAPEGTLVVAWVDARAPLAGRRWTERVTLASRGVYDFEIGLISGETAPPEPPSGAPDEAPWTFASGARASVPGVTTALRERPERRHEDAAAATLARLAEANPAASEGARGMLARGLALHAAAQGPSSPFVSLALQTEVDVEALPALAAATTAGRDAFQRGLWEGLARLLADKRMPDKVLEHVEPLAERYAPWPALDRVVAIAYIEFGMPAEAADQLGRAVAANPYDLDLIVQAAEWAGRAGDAAREVELLRDALAMQPQRRDLERLLTIALLRAGEPEGVERAQALLASDPDDEELRELLAPGPHVRPEAEVPGVHGMHDEDEH